MKKRLTRTLAAALALGLITINTHTVTPTVTYENLTYSPFVPVYSLIAPTPEMPDSPFAPDFSPRPAPELTINTPFVPVYPSAAQ